MEYDEYESQGGYDDDFDDFDGDDGFDEYEDIGTVRIACAGLADPALAIPVVNRFTEIEGVLEVEPDLANHTVELEVDLSVTSAEEIWDAIEGDTTIQPKAIL